MVYSFSVHLFPIVLLGFFGHVVVGLTVWKFFRSNRSMVLLLGLFFPDFLLIAYESFNYFYQITTKRRWFYGESPGCTFEGYLHTMVCFLNLSVSGLVAYQRYRPICHPLKNQDSILQMYVMYAACWISAFIAAAVAAQLRFTLTYSKSYCMMDFTVPGNFILAGLCIACFLPFTFYYYWRIYRKMDNMAASFTRNKTRSAKLRKVAKAFMILACFMALCWTPCFIYIFVIVSNIVPLHESAVWDQMAHLCVMLNASANPYLALWLFPSLREKAKQLVVKKSSPVSIVPSPEEADNTGDTTGSSEASSK